MNKNEIAAELNNETIESMIYDIRGVKVMLDFNLAKIYGYSTKAFNQQVQRNIEKYPTNNVKLIYVKRVKDIEKQKKNGIIKTI